MQKIFWLIAFLTINILPADMAKSVYGIFDLPGEVLDCISQYLIFKDREFDDEFYARTKACAPKKDCINEVKKRKEIQRDLVFKALSRDGTMRIDTKEYRGTVALGVLLYIISLVTKKTIKKYQLQYCNNDLVRAYFNKQGTKAIVYKDSTGSSIKIPLTTDKEHEERSKKTFADYCKQYCICKGISVLIATI